MKNSKIGNCGTHNSKGNMCNERGFIPNNEFDWTERVSEPCPNCFPDGIHPKGSDFYDKPDSYKDK